MWVHGRNWKEYDAAFKVKVNDLAVEEGNTAAAHKLGINDYHDGLFN